MKREIEYLKAKFVLGFVTLTVGLLGATIALFGWIETTGVQYLFGDYSRYVLGFGGFAAMIFGAMLINDVLVLRDVQKGKYKLPSSYLKNNTTIYDEVKLPHKSYIELETPIRAGGYKEKIIQNILKEQSKGREFGYLKTSLKVIFLNTWTILFLTIAVSVISVIVLTLHLI